MSTIHWKNSVDGAFSKAKYWAGKVAPGPTDDALLEAVGANFTVTSNAAVIVNSIQLAADATLNVTGKSFTASAGTGSGENAGVIGIYGTGVLSVGGQLDNTGVITLNGAGSSESQHTTLMFSSDTILTGGGEIKLSNNYSNTIICSGVTLTNVDNVISGSGRITSRTLALTLVNEAGGVIEGAGAGLKIGPLASPRGFITNDGLLESTGFGGLFIDKMNVTGSGSIIGNSGSVVEFIACTITGQSLSTQAGGEIRIAHSHATIATVVTNAGELDVIFSKVALNGGVNNSGVIFVDGVLSVGGDVTGSGEVLLDGKLAVASAFSQNVAFTNIRGPAILQLGDSQAYTGEISSFSAKGHTKLDLRDIGFVSAGEATFSGTSSSGVLTVTDGTHTAHIVLEGDYLSANFVASSDGGAGTTVVANGGTLAPLHGFIAALAGLGGSAGGAIQATHAPVAHDPVLARPHGVAGGFNLSINLA